MIKGRRLHDMMCSTSETYLPLYCEKSLRNRLINLIKVNGKIRYDEHGRYLLNSVIYQHLLEKGFYD